MGADPRGRHARRENGKARKAAAEKAHVKTQFSSPAACILFFPALVGEKVNSLEKLADVGRIVDRGSCFGEGVLHRCNDSNSSARLEPEVTYELGAMASYGLDSHASRVVIHHCQSLH